MSEEHVVPLAPGIFVDGNPAIAAVKKGSQWDLIYLTESTGRNSFKSTATIYTQPGGLQHKVTIKGDWAASPEEQ
ncbi:hypothetical protein [Mycobacteroides abscessus]|uniref:hypothetical protein n=1 Tax=Mycobacteroides abscessus TaxID=36809 RepID=UPI00039D7B9B|nr:hypothetical protein [Mycobacteroides abscessus]MBN7483886.1 hypothetical protein [Mycobacteroides abscessus subsp. massiliense]BBZ82295.1 hypothetical protein MABM_22110 [Mycobacteroides abscessus]